MMMNLMNVLLMTPPQEGQNPLVSFLPLLLIIVVFYFFMIRPQVKKQKELKNYREALKKGDKVITTGGIYGRVADVKETTLTVEVADKVLLKVDKSAILRDATDMQQQK
jgi:preprotein translocase subunit YajC